MRILITFLSFLFLNTGFSQEKLLNQCFVFELNTNAKTDLRHATFDLPFAAMSSSKDNDGRVVPHYAFDLKADGQDKGEKNNGISIISIRPYVYGETLSDNEIAFFATEWPEDFRPSETSSVLASFPSINDYKVSTDHFIIDHRLKLPQLLSEQLNLETSYLEPGIYRLYKQDVVY